MADEKAAEPETREFPIEVTVGKTKITVTLPLEADLVDGFFQHREWIARAVLVAVFPRGLFLLAIRPTAYRFAHVFGHASGA